MTIYCIFDDFPSYAADSLRKAGNELTILPNGVNRPDNAQMKKIMELYDCIIIGTSQKITEDMFENIDNPKIIATASVGLDHINIPEDKKHLITIFNTPLANAKAVAEYTIGMMLLCCKRINEGCKLYAEGKNNKNLIAKPRELSSLVLGVIGAGNISRKTIEYANVFGMSILCWTRNPERHIDLQEKGIHFVELDDIVQKADIISVNLPDTEGTKNIISKELINKMKNNCIFISISRIATIDVQSLLNKAQENREFYFCADIDIDPNVVKRYNAENNIYITPHIAGGTKETRIRMFNELTEQIILKEK